MDNQTHKCSAFFKLFGGDNLQVAFNICEDDPDTHLNLMESYVEELLKRGYTVDPKGLEPNEKIQEADSWVMGITSKGDKALKFFKSPLKWQVATVYEEDFDQLPFKVPTDVTPNAGSVDREQAEKAGVLHTITPEIKLVLEPTGKMSDKGNPIMRFARMYGAVKVENNGADKHKDEEEKAVPYAEVMSNLDGKSLKLVKWARKEQAKGKAAVSTEDLNLLTDVLDDMLQEVSSGVMLLSVLTGLDAYNLDEASAWVVKNLLETIPEYVEVEGEVKDNPKYKEESAEAVTGIWAVAKKHFVEE